MRKHYEWIINQIKSCISEEQLDMCGMMIDNFKAKYKDDHGHTSLANHLWKYLTERKQVFDADRFFIHLPKKEALMTEDPTAVKESTDERNG